MREPMQGVPETHRGYNREIAAVSCRCVMAYGGVKDSGLGREGLRFAMQEMTEIRLMVIRTPGG